MIHKIKQDNSELEKWQKRLSNSSAHIDTSLMDERSALYKGTKAVDGNPNSSKSPSKVATNVRNIVFELIESQVDSNIPMPRVRARRPEDTHLAEIIEDVLRAKLDELPFEEMNDLQERIALVQGGALFVVDWDSEKRTHTSIGDIAVSVLHPKQYCPQIGVDCIDDSDYLIIRLAKTKAYIKRKYGVDVETEGEDAPEMRCDSAATSEDMVTLNVGYYRNKNGGIGLFVWVNDLVLENVEDYQARQLERCTKCGEVKQGDTCICGGKSFKKTAEEYEELISDIVTQTLTVPAYTEEVATVKAPDMDGVIHEVETVKRVRTKIPYYKPDIYPVIIRKNVSAYGEVFGVSDVDMIRTHQDAVKKLGSKIMEKVLSGGSYITLPKGVGVPTNDKEFKVVRLDNPSQKALIDVLNLQPDISKDMNTLLQEYQFAKSTLGINDSFQGKSDNTATSGTAKQFAAAQTAGRLESKRKMKNAAYQRLFEIMFKFLLAYTDEPFDVETRDKNGNKIYTTFNRYDFLKQDVAGEYYWEDDFLFSVDVTGGLAQNREAMWEEANNKFQSGAMGVPTDINTQILYWTLMEQLQYPMANTIKTALEERRQTQLQQPLPTQFGTDIPMGAESELMAQISPDMLTLNDLGGVVNEMQI